MQGNPVIVALDVPDQASALALAAQLDPSLCRVKVGKQLFTAAGPACVEKLAGMGFEVFLDLKFHDIPTTVELACRAAANLGVWMLNVHALGGPDMLAAARSGTGQGSRAPLLIGVTLLTSMNQSAMQAIGLSGTPEAAVLRLAGLTRDAGLDGVVCSAQEAALLAKEMGRDFVLVTPGIRLAEAEQHDQSRVMTPEAALHAGSHYLVIGRPVTHAADPAAALRAIRHSIDNMI